MRRPVSNFCPTRYTASRRKRHGAAPSVAPRLIEEKTLQKRPFGKTGWQVSEIGFGAWAIGGSWGDVSDRDAEAALNAALDQGMTFIDTADVYGDGRSERLIARVLKS